jgi:hypothetical protein
LIDTSLLEGLGLTPLEAIRAHCIPVATRKGGLESVNPPKDWMVWVDSPFISQEELVDAIGLSESEKDPGSSHADEFFKHLNLKLGISETVKFLERF